MSRSLATRHSSLPFAAPPSPFGKSQTPKNTGLRQPACAPVRCGATDERQRYLLIPVLDPGTDVLEVLDIAGDDRSAVLDGMCGDEDVSIVMGAAP